MNEISIKRSVFGLCVFLIACQNVAQAPVRSPQSIPQMEGLAEQGANSPQSASSAQSPSNGVVIPTAASALPELTLKPEWRFSGQAPRGLTGTGADSKGFFVLQSPNRLLDSSGLSYQVANSPWQNEAGETIEGPSQAPTNWDVRIYALQSDGKRYGFPLAKTTYQGGFSEIHWNGISDSGQKAKPGAYEIVAIPSGFPLRALTDPLQLLNSPLPASDEAPPPVYKTDHLLARFHDLALARQNYKISEADAAGWSQVIVPESQDPERVGKNLLALAQQLQQDQNVMVAEPDLILDLDFLPNDPRLSEQYALAKVKAESAWDIELGRSSVVVAIVDSGVDLAHPDLRQQLVAGWNVPGNNSNANDDNGHGTHCAGITAATGNNSLGVSGLAPGVKIMPVKVMNASGQGSSLDIATGIRWAVDHGAQIINLSLGASMASEVIREAIHYALGKGVTVVAAMGNDGGTIRSYPAADAPNMEGLIAVGATDRGDGRAYFSNYGSWITVAAPGYDILSTLPTYAVQLNPSGQAYGPLSGTSMATPYVAGLAALLKSQQSARQPADIKAALIQGADDLGATGFDNQFGYGRINAARSLGLNLPIPSPTPTPLATPTPLPTPSPSSRPPVSTAPGGLILDIN